MISACRAHRNLPEYTISNHYSSGYDVIRIGRFVRHIKREKIFTTQNFHLHIAISSFPSIKMSFQDINSYITHLPTLQVVVCRFCEACIPPKDPLRHYEDNHTAKKAYHIPMEIRRKIRDYMATLEFMSTSGSYFS